MFPIFSKPFDPFAVTSVSRYEPWRFDLRLSGLPACL